MKISRINWITNVFGTIGGVPQIIAGYVLIKNGDTPNGVAKIIEGLAILAIGYFTGKSALSLGIPGK